MNLFGSKAKWARTSNAPSLPTAGRSASSARLMWKLCMTGREAPLLSGVAAGRPVSLEELRYFSPVGEEYRLKSASSNSLKTLRPISSSSRAEEGRADAVAAAGGGLVKRVDLLTYNTPPRG